MWRRSSEKLGRNQRRLLRNIAEEYGLDQDEQLSWQTLMDEMLQASFEGYRGDLRLAEALIDRVGLIEGKRLGSL